MTLSFSASPSTFPSCVWALGSVYSCLLSDGIFSLAAELSTALWRFLTLVSSLIIRFIRKLLLADGEVNLLAAMRDFSPSLWLVYKPNGRPLLRPQPHPLTHYGPLRKLLRRSLPVYLLSTIKYYLHLPIPRVPPILLIRIPGIFGELRDLGRRGHPIRILLRPLAHCAL